MNKLSKRVLIAEEKTQPGEWFEKSPMFLWRDDMEFDIQNIGELEASNVADEDPEQFFYRGLHREHPTLESRALKNMIKDNAKFYFIFKYHEREEKEFKDLLEPAAETLSIQDARAFFYFHLHHVFPELGRGAIIQLIDTNPESFHEFGLNKDYPDLLDSASSAMNLVDPSRTQIDEHVPISIRK